MNPMWGNGPVGRMYRRLHNVWLHDVSDRMRIRRQAIAAADGLDPEDVESYPVTGDVTIVQQEGSLMRTLAGGAALLFLGGILGFGSLIALKALEYAAGEPEPTVNQPVPAGATSTGQVPPPQDFRVRFWLEDETGAAVEEIPVQ